MSSHEPKSTYHSQSVESVFESMSVEPDQGLAESDVRCRLDNHGPNKLREAKRRSIGDIVFEQFKSMVIMVLVAAGTVAFVFQHWAEGIAIVAVLLVNAVLGFATEWKALRSMEALREMGGEKSRVRRGGEDLEIDSERLVPGDIVVVEAGDIAPADVRLFSPTTCGSTKRP